MDNTTATLLSEGENVFRLPLSLKILCISFYSLLCIFSVYGNLLVIMVIIYFRRLRTATNILILNLAIADLLIGIFCMPFSYWQILIFDDQRWIFGSALCSVLSFFQGAAVFLSSWTLVVISFDRWMAITFVLAPSMRLTRRRATYMVITTWIFSLTMALPLFLVTQQVTEEGVHRCVEKWNYFHDEESAKKIYSYLVLALQYSVPQTVLIITYTYIGVKMWNSRVPGVGSASTKKIIVERHQSVKKLIPMVVLVSALFAICWLPLLLLFNIILDVWPELNYWNYILYLWWFCHGLAMLHSIVNPLIYFLRNARFREGFLFFSSRIMPFIKFDELRLLTDNSRRPYQRGKGLKMMAYVPIASSSPPKTKTTMITQHR
ncbi:unnamed protein product, partial [Mesorhabditis belari]|uniref:G-protein coupled receptors family 1 profile domain-containing protein n=1 Tax=Mesorhabditis belari TaxID=2138241 RepID=A0AAF3EBA2_9BILA